MGENRRDNMEGSVLLKRVVDFQKASFDNSFETMAMVQSQSERIVETLWDHSHRSSKEAQTAFSQWAAVCRQSRSDFKKAVDDGYAKLTVLFEDYLGREPSKVKRQEKKQERIVPEKQEPVRPEKTKEK
jgi:hypothetical protein